MMSVVVDWFTF